MLIIHKKNLKFDFKSLEGGEFLRLDIKVDNLIIFITRHIVELVIKIDSSKFHIKVDIFFVLYKVNIS